jgi:hypothetical protein
VARVVGRLNIRSKIVPVILLIIVSVLVISFFSFPGDSYSNSIDHTDMQNTAIASQQSAHPDSTQINLMDGVTKQMMLFNNAVYKSYKNLLYSLRIVFYFIPLILCTISYSIYACHYFCKKTTKPLCMIAVPLGGHAPPFALS